MIQNYPMKQLFRTQKCARVELVWLWMWSLRKSYKKGTIFVNFWTFLSTYLITSHCNQNAAPIGINVRKHRLFLLFPNFPFYTTDDRRTYSLSRVSTPQPKAAVFQLLLKLRGSIPSAPGSFVPGDEYPVKVTSAPQISLVLNCSGELRWFLPRWPEVVFLIRLVLFVPWALPSSRRRMMRAPFPRLK